MLTLKSPVTSTSQKTAERVKQSILGAEVSGSKVAGSNHCVEFLTLQKYLQGSEEILGSKTKASSEVGPSERPNSSTSCVHHHLSLDLNQQPVEPLGQEPVGVTRDASPSLLSFGLMVSKGLGRRKRRIRVRFIVGRVTKPSLALVETVENHPPKPNIEIVFSSAWF